MQLILRTWILNFAVIILLSGCAGPAAIIGQVYSGVDALTSITTGRGAADTVISEINSKDCKVFRLFKGKKVCKELTEEAKVDRMMRMGCKIFSFDENNMPYCKEIAEGKEDDLD
jgi:hypothetical protein